MDIQAIERIINETAYVRTGGTMEELKCAQYLQQQCRALGYEAALEPFTVPMATMRKATLTVDGKEIPCKGYFCAGSGTVEAPIYYLRDNNPAEEEEEVVTPGGDEPMVDEPKTDGPDTTIIIIIAAAAAVIVIAVVVIVIVVSAKKKKETTDNEITQEKTEE